MNYLINVDLPLLLFNPSPQLDVIFLEPAKLGK